MQFCPQCNNSFDIARTKIQQGGGDSDSFDSDNDSDVEQYNEYDHEQFGGEIYETFIERTLNAEDLGELPVDKMSVKDLTANNAFKKLSSNEKELVYNMLQDMLPKNKKKISQSKGKIEEGSKAYFVCNNCGFSKSIEDGTLIYSNNSDVSGVRVDHEIIKDLADSNILWHTRKYICPNGKCDSHKDPTKRIAKFYRKTNTYAVEYICTSCHAVF